MLLFRFFVRVIVYILTFIVSWFAMTAFDFQRILKKNHVRQAQVLYFLFVMALAYLAGSFILAFMYQI